MTIYNVFLENPPVFLNAKNFLHNLKHALNFMLSLDEIKNFYALRGFDFKSLSFDIVFCNDEEIQRINCKYRKKDKPTDVITFAVFADSEPKFVLDGDIALGEIIISVESAQKQAKQSVEKEIFTLILHGVLHLLGFDHTDKESYNFVVRIQEKVLKSVEISV